MNDIAQFLWFEGKLSALENLCLRSFLANSYDVHLYTYRQVANVPPGVKVLPGQDILSEDKLVFNTGADGRRTSYTAFSDLFRLKLIHEKGGWWFDMDMICLQYLPPPTSFYVASTWEGVDGECACPCAIWAPAGDPLVRELYQMSSHVIQTSQTSLGIPEAGVFPLQDLVRRHNLYRSVAPWWEFCPYPWRFVYRLASRNSSDYAKDVIRQVKHRTKELLDPQFKAGYLRKGSRTLHFHNEMWKACGLDKDATYFRLSLIERLKQRYQAQRP